MTIEKVKEYVESLYIGELAISSPFEIDIEAIAFYKNALVVERPLTGCEAMIIGAGNNAIITVKADSNNERKRFSIGHELGHWIKDRGTIGNLCSQSDMDETKSHQQGRETIANAFASELLIPSYLLTKYINDSPLNLDLLSGVKEAFQISFMASLRRVIGSQQHLGFFAIYRSDGSRRLFHANKKIPYSFLPPDTVPNGSKIFDLIFNGHDKGAGFINGSVWCKDDWADESEVFEHSFHYHNDDFISIVWWKDEEPVWRCLDSKN
ncbi:ImmA/IrrE family metallo-endopeptidase [Methylophaga pinxianii]|uniref:ImmA/IrrE family metallo-endopeptidase n=1 Tax=Methylophaga pinxianii TaxID=2881052 RepID=UPI001CF3E8A4|nr:ImmA/IrrE family metallo-endopeptidase [Methylophaga pinxianii]MCB2425494.1 ImmA/IrrE family metallo-endopeptidase [Methylophaga pinxianii]UPH46408.1 ImmA/IrrE family metallo-endopeptidase [Methylophaga pinxianii]